MNRRSSIWDHATGSGEWLELLCDWHHNALDFCIPSEANEQHSNFGSDLRHTGLTKLAEKNPEQVVLKLAGHVSPQMLRKVYAHVRLPALRSAVDSVGSVSVVRVNPQKPPKENEVRPEQTLFHVAKMAEQLGIDGDKALQLLLEYERQQACERKEPGNDAEKISGLLCGGPVCRGSVAVPRAPATLRLRGDNVLAAGSDLPFVRRWVLGFIW
jgi:hypothetical protein